MFPRLACTYSSCLNDTNTQYKNEVPWREMKRESGEGQGRPGGETKKLSTQFEISHQTGPNVFECTGPNIKPLFSSCAVKGPMCCPNGLLPAFCINVKPQTRHGSKYYGGSLAPYPSDDCSQLVFLFDHGPLHRCSITASLWVSY